VSSETAPVWTRQDLARLDADDLDSRPGEPPYLRGIHPRMYAERPWAIRQYAGFGTAAASNAYFRRALERGETGLSVAFDLPTHRGFDSDSVRARHDVGLAGAAVDSVEDMKEMFDGIDLSEVSVSMTINGNALVLYCCFLVAAEETGVPPAALRGTFQNDVLKEYAVRNSYIYPPRAGLRILGDIVEYAAVHTPKVFSMSVSSHHFREGGAGPSEELAYGICSALAYVRAAARRGVVDLAQAVDRVSFVIGTGMDLFREVAKLRAARVLWARAVRDRLGLTDAKLQRLRFHAQTAGTELTRQRPYNNIARVALEALAGVLGGAQSLHTNAFDEAIGLPSELAARVARDTQLILAHESKVTEVVDPLGGSYYVESLTAEIVAETERLIEEIEARGGMAAAIEDGSVKRHLDESLSQQEEAIASGQRIIVGLNRFAEEDEFGEQVEARFVDGAAILAEQTRKLERLRGDRDSGRVERALKELRRAAASDDNLVPPTLEAIRARATVGETCQALVDVFTRHRAHTSTAAVPAGLLGDDESEQAGVRAQVARFEQVGGRRPRILLAKVGQDGHDRGLKLIAAGLAEFGFEVDISPLFLTPGEAAKFAVESDAHAIGLSLITGDAVGLVRELLGALDGMGALGTLVFCAGNAAFTQAAELSALESVVALEAGQTMASYARSIIEAVAETAR
jgi:methylmalonyl-CoA mutase